MGHRLLGGSKCCSVEISGSSDFDLRGFLLVFYGSNLGPFGSGLDLLVLI